MKGSSPRPVWLTWLLRIVGGFLILVATLRLPFVCIALWKIWQGWASFSKLPSELQARLLGYLTGQLIGIGAFLYFGFWLIRKTSKKADSAAASDPVAGPALRLAQPAPARRVPTKRWGTCNVLLPGAQLRHLWQFNAGGNRFSLAKSEAKLPSEPLTEKLVSKDWHSLFQPRLNIAWLSAEKVFLRVLQLPKADAEETQSMIDLQLEKISPLPVAQIVWSYEVFPFIAQGGASDHLNPIASGEQQTVVVIMVARNHVEEFLGQLETQGYIADRLELPLLDELRSTNVRTNGAWVFPGIGGSASACMVAWWYDGVLQSLTLLHLPTGDTRATVLREQISQTAWAGEMEGWMTSEPRYHLVADEATAATWVPLFDPNIPVEVVPPPAPELLASMTARRVATTQSTTNLLPAEYAKRYRQLFVDRIWMRSLGAILLLYIFGVIIYIALVQVASFRYDSVQTVANAKGIEYTNTIKLKEKLHVLQETLELQYAALESYNAVAESMPPELTLDSMNFDRGQKVTFFGTAGVDDRSKVFEFNEALLKIMVNGQPLFSKVNIGRVDNKPGTTQLSWSLNCDLRRTDTE